jgi:hypothetical protein
MMMVVMVSPAVDSYLLDRAALAGAGLQRLKHAGRWRGVCGSGREADSGAQRRNHQ